MVVLRSAGLGGKPGSANQSVRSSREVDGDPMNDVIHKARELEALVVELKALDHRRVGLGDRLVDLEHFFRRAGCPELSQQALDAFVVTYAGRVLELADGMRD